MIKSPKMPNTLSEANQNSDSPYTLTGKQLRPMMTIINTVTQTATWTGGFQYCTTTLAAVNPRVSRRVPRWRPLHRFRDDGRPLSARLGSRNRLLLEDLCTGRGFRQRSPLCRTPGPYHRRTEAACPNVPIRSCFICGMQQQHLGGSLSVTARTKTTFYGIADRRDRIGAPKSHTDSRC